MEIQKRKEFVREKSKMDDPEGMMTMRQLLEEDGKDRLMKHVNFNEQSSRTMRSGFLIDGETQKILRNETS